MSFSTFFPAEFKGKKIDSFSPEALADLNYDDELFLKNKALRNLLEEPEFVKVLFPIVPSPLARNYRTTSKRRITLQSEKLYFHFGKNQK